MTYQEFKNNYSFDTGKGHINFYNKAKDELYNFFDIFYQNMPYISVEELLSSEQMKENIQTLLDNLKNNRDIFRKNRILSYEDFKKRISCNNEGDIDIDLYSEEELYNLSKWSIQAREELFNARKKSNILTENINSENDMLTKEEMNIPFQDLINKYEKL